MRRLNILTWHIHGSYLNTLARIEHNWYLPISSQQNGWVYRFRVDYNITDNTKLFLSFQNGSNTSFQPAHIWWNPSFSVPFPGNGISNPTNSKTASLNFLHVFNPTLTNEMILTWNRANSPYTPNNLEAAYAVAKTSNKLKLPNANFGTEATLPVVPTTVSRPIGQVNTSESEDEFLRTAPLSKVKDYLEKKYQGSQKV